MVKSSYTSSGNLIQPRKSAVVFDLDNTIFDTAIRKHAILCNHFSGRLETPPSVEEVRRDFSLSGVFTDDCGVSYSEFLDFLESPKALRQYPAPIFAGVQATLEFCASKGYKLIALTGRPESLRQETINDLRSVGELSRTIELLMPVNKLREEDVAHEKGRIIHDLLRTHDVVVCIGDRPADIYAARANEVPAVLLTTTTSAEQIAELSRDCGVGFAVAQSWDEIPPLIEVMEAGSAEMQALRRAFIDYYASWLTDIDGKAGVCVTLATALSALSGYLIVESAESHNFWERLGLLLLCAAFLSSVLSLLYAISAFTSRRTSGKSSGESVRLTLRQWFGALRSSPESWLRIPGNAIDDFDRLKSSSASEQARAHVGFFFGRYGTYDPSALENLRLFELRATNYVKLYSERSASLLLRLGIIMLMIWVLLKMVASFGVEPRVRDKSVPSGEIRLVGYEIP